MVLSESSSWSAFWGFTPPREGFARAKSAALTALSLDETIAEAHSALGVVLGIGDFDWRGAGREFERAFEVNASSAVARCYYAGWNLQPVGEVEQGLAEMRRALAIDPLDRFYNTMFGYLLFTARRFDDSIAQLQHTVTLDPMYYFAYWFLSLPLARQGRLDETIAAARKANDLSAGSAVALGNLGKAYGLAGRTDEAREILRQLEARRASSYVPACAFAFVHAGLREVEEAVEWMTRGVDEHDPILVASMKMSPSYDALRSHPAYPGLLRKMNLES